jgi:integrase
MSSGIMAAIAERVGVTVNPHLFRAFVGCLILEDEPGALEDIRLLLGHKTLATALAYYVYINPKLAARRIDAVLRRARGKGALVIAPRDPNGRRSRQ